MTDQHLRARPADFRSRPAPLDRPNAARLYDYLLGGNSYTPIEREVGELMAAAAPHWPNAARLSRAFSRRAVETMAAAGVDQFIELGSGIPTGGSVHELARSLNVNSTVLYVDKEPVACEIGRQLLANESSAAILNLDIRNPNAIVDHPTTRELIDFSRPVGVLAVAVLLFVPDDDDPGDIVRQFREHLVPGSFVAITQVSDDCPDPEVAAQVAQVREHYDTHSDRVYPRSREEILSWFDGTDLMEPGLVRCGRWRHEFPLTALQAQCEYGYVGLGRVN